MHDLGWWANSELLLCVYAFRPCVLSPYASSSAQGIHNRAAPAVGAVKQVALEVHRRVHIEIRCANSHVHMHVIVIVVVPARVHASCVCACEFMFVSVYIVVCVLACKGLHVSCPRI
jgi:hypothetical protein